MSLAKIAICMPTREQMHSRCAFSLYNLGKALSKAGIEHSLFLSPGTLIANQRHELVKAAQEWGATHVMFIDSDIVFKPSHVIELINFNEPIVGAAYSKRIEPVVATAWHSIDNWDSHVRLHEQTDSHIKVDAMALGFCLIKTEVFDQLDLPWFILGFHDGHYTGEDIEFFRNCKHNNIPVWLDVKISFEIGHLGLKEFKNANDIVVSLAT
jgi:hypothetical protein